MLRLPAAALRYRPASTAAKKRRARTKQAQQKRNKRDRRVVWVLRDGKPTAARIKVGLSDGTHVEVVDGELTEQDQVITAAVGGDATDAKPTKKQASNLGRRGRGRIF